VGLLKFPQAAAGCARKRPLQVAKELAGGQLAAQESAVDPVKGLGTAGAERPEGLGYQLFAGAGFTGDEHRQVGGGQARQMVQQGSKGRVPGEQPGQGGPGGLAGSGTIRK
jgi:hypothetical protein